MTNKHPDKVDIEIGKRVRKYREQAKLNQAQLGRELGVAYQQIQKYEIGENRLSCGRLYRIAGVLKVDIGLFFEGLPL